MSILPLIDEFCTGQHKEYGSYEELVNVDLKDIHDDTFIGFFCIIDFYWMAQ